MATAVDMAKTLALMKRIEELEATLVRVRPAPCDSPSAFECRAVDTGEKCDAHLIDTVLARGVPDWGVMFLCF